MPYFHHHLSLIKSLRDMVETQPPFNQSTLSEEDSEFLALLQAISKEQHQTESLLENGQLLISKIVACYPHITPHVPRELFWFFGGDCLHYMPDEEIAGYQRLDELRFEAEENGEEFDFEKERVRIFGLH